MIIWYSSNNRSEITYEELIDYEPYNVFLDHSLVFF